MLRRLSMKRRRISSRFPRHSLFRRRLVRKDGDGDTEDTEEWSDDNTFSPRFRRSRKLKDSVRLTDAELRQEIENTLRVKDPEFPEDRVFYDNKERGYQKPKYSKMGKRLEWLIDHYTFESILEPKVDKSTPTPPPTVPKEDEGIDEPESVVEIENLILPDENAAIPSTDAVDEGDEEITSTTSSSRKLEEQESVESEEPEKQEAEAIKKKLDPFKFYDRGTETTNNEPYQNVTTQTESISKKNFSAGFTKFEIREVYRKHFPAENDFPVDERLEKLLSSSHGTFVNLKPILLADSANRVPTGGLTRRRERARELEQMRKEEKERSRIIVYNATICKETGTLICKGCNSVFKNRFASPLFREIGNFLRKDFSARPSRNLDGVLSKFVKKDSLFSTKNEPPPMDYKGYLPLSCRRASDFGTNVLKDPSLIYNRNFRPVNTLEGFHEYFEGVDLATLLRPAKIVERMVNQNINREIVRDFKYWEDPSDEFRDPLGTLLPLWRFCHIKAKNLSVTSMSCSHFYKDLFAIGLGSHDLLKQGKGLVCVFSLKNTCNPEYLFMENSGCMCLDFHHSHAAALVAGFYDGQVVVYYLNEGETVKPTKEYLASIDETNNGTHQSVIWQVKWLANTNNNELVFLSLSSDSSVITWIAAKDVVKPLKIMVLKNLVRPGGSLWENEDVADDMNWSLCFAVHPQDEKIFLVGTEEGDIYRIERDSTTCLLGTYRSHTTSVYKLEWNPFHPGVFISCSADWTVRVWEQDSSVPMYTFDLRCPVSDVTWSRYSSTAFAIASSERQVDLYDLNVDKNKPICSQTVVGKKTTRLTSIIFGRFDPVVFVGNDRGKVVCLKLSPNLRKIPKEAKGASPKKVREIEYAKINKHILLSHYMDSPATATTDNEPNSPDRDRPTS